VIFVVLSIMTTTLSIIGSQHHEIVDPDAAPRVSSWNGEVDGVKEYLQSIANDPDSVRIYKCTPPQMTKAGWCVICEYGAKNGFGAMVRKVGVLFFRNGKVVLFCRNEVPEEAVVAARLLKGGNP
jgi:NAD(P)H-flavin reductase